jgi:hypothetical protein
MVSDLGQARDSSDNASRASLQSSIGALSRPETLAQKYSTGSSTSGSIFSDSSGPYLNVNVDGKSQTILGNSGSDLSLSVPYISKEEEEFNEDEDILEFKLNHDSDSGIIRNRAPTEDGIPQVIRYAMGSRSTSQVDQVHSQGHGAPHLFKQDLNPTAKTHMRNPSLPSEYSHQSALQSEFSHLNDNAEKESVDEEDEEGEWQDMKTVGSHDVYDEKGRVIIHRKPSRDLAEEDFAHISASKGYTRVTADDDVKSINSMDENTDFLFDEDELSRDPLSQLQATKDMLTDSQKIAYVGLCRLVMTDMAADLAAVRGGRRIARGLSDAQGSMAMWCQKMMIRLYSHMDLSPEGKFYCLVGVSRC